MGVETVVVETPGNGDFVVVAEGFQHDAVPLVTAWARRGGGWVTIAAQFRIEQWGTLRVATETRESLKVVVMRPIEITSAVGSTRPASTSATTEASLAAASR